MTSVFFATPNLTLQAMTQVLPWEFMPSQEISEQVKHSKIDRQTWYQASSTSHQFYAGVEGANPNQRVGKSNPARKIHAIVADFDLPLDAERIATAVKKMKIPPAWIERSLGGNARLVWPLARPILTDSNDFATFILQESIKWLQLELLPGLDAKALQDPARLYCNGCSWAQTGAPAINENLVQGFYVEAGAKYNFKDIGTGTEIPLDIAEKEIIRKFPGFSWPNPFEIGSQGPSFWVEGSTSAMSAIVKAEGLFTFSAHADKPFYSWSDLLGTEFAKEFQTNAVALATKNVFFDGKLYWAMNETEGRFISMARDTLTNHLKVNCRVSSKPDKTGISRLDRCLAHIHAFAHVEGGAPILFQPPGLLIYCGAKLVNTCARSKIIKPSGTDSQWGADGNFPFISSVLSGLFSPAEQLDPFLAWLQYFYRAALKETPSPGQNIFLAGGQGVGKTLVNREVIGGLMGGHMDAARFMVGDRDFNSSLFQSAVWSVDDETISDSEAAHRKFSSYIKLCAANQSFEYRKKFEHNVMIPWQGRVIVTLNLDDASSRSLPALDGSIMDKVSFFRCAASSRVVFPDREVIKKLLVAELPNLAQWLVDWKTPEQLIGESRYGVRPHHEPMLLDKAHQSGKSSPFKELLIEFLTRYFDDNPKAAEWRGSITQLFRSLSADPLNDVVLRSLRLEQVNRYCEMLSKEGVIDCRSESGERKTRLWIFNRLEK